MNSCTPQTPLEAKIHRGFGDTQGNGENYCSWCETCHGYHEEHIRVLMAVTGWPCTRAQNYNREVLKRCLETTVADRRTFDAVHRRVRRLAPYWRKPDESDPRYLQRMVALHKARPKWDQMLADDGQKDVDRYKGLRLPPHLQEKADEIKRRHPITTRKPAHQRKRRMGTGSRSVSVRTPSTWRGVRKGASRPGRKPNAKPKGSGN